MGGGSGGLEESLLWLKGLSEGNTAHEFERLSMKGVEVVEARQGFLRCRFVIPSGVLVVKQVNRLPDRDENWHAGAIATLMDNVGAAAICSVLGHIRLSLDFSISFYSTAKFQEEVEIAAKVLRNIGRLSSVVIEVRRKGDGEVIALGKQWMAEPAPSHQIRSRI